MSRFKLALLGCGDVAQRDYLPEFHRIEDRAELVAVCGRTEQRARAVAEEHGVEAWYTDYREMLRKCEADAVINLTPIQMHLETNLAALRAGKHVYSEKPVAPSVNDARQLGEEARQRGLVLVCAPSVMLFPQVLYAQQVLREGMIGEVYSARGHGYGGVPPWSGYTSDPSQFFSAGGGPARDMGVYPLHALTGLLGPARSVTAMTTRVLQSFTVGDGPAQGKQVRVEEDDNWQLLLDFGNSRLASVSANNVVQDSRAPQLELYGLGGTIALDLLDVSAPVEILRRGAEWESIEIPHVRQSGPDHLLGVEHLLECIGHGTESILSIEHAAHVIEIIEAGHKAAQTGRTQKLETAFQLPAVTDFLRVRSPLACGRSVTENQGG